MSRKMKKLHVIVILLIITTSLYGCVFPLIYRGEYPELHAIAIHSLLGVSGYDNDRIAILEEDGFGRVMFSYLGYANTASGVDHRIFAILIGQSMTEIDSCFYDNINYIICEIDGSVYNGFTVVDTDFVMKHFTDEQVEGLKLENDWNMELDRNKFFKVSNTRERTTPLPISTLRKAFENVSHDFHASYATFLTMDKNGNLLYFMRGKKPDSKNGDYFFTQSYLFMFDNDGKLVRDTGIMELTDLWNYRAQLKSFKEANNWSFGS